MDTSDSRISFDEDGVSDNVNEFYNNVLPNWNTDEVGAKKLYAIIDKIKADGKKRDFDCILGLSGGG